MLERYVSLSLKIRELTSMFFGDGFEPNGEDCDTSERGATATEYAIMAGMIAFSIIFGARLFATRLVGEYVRISNTIPS